jgi:invasion protein IalB
MIKTGSLRATLTRACMATFIGAVFLAGPVQAQQNRSSEQPFSAGKKLAPLELPPLPKKEYPKKKFGDWTQQCDVRPGVTERKCFLTQTAVQTRDGRKLALLGVTIGYFGADKKLGIIFRVPLALGVFLPNGFKFNVPGIDPVPVGVQFCLTQGCSATTLLTPEIVAAIGKGDAGSLEVQTIKKRIIRMPISFKGFTEGLASLNKG